MEKTKKMSLEEKAKTGLWITQDLEAHDGYGDRLRSLEQWVRLSDAQQEIADCRTSWQNLKDTIPKFEAKIGYLEDQLKNRDELTDKLQQEIEFQESVAEDWRKKYNEQLDCVQNAVELIVAVHNRNGILEFQISDNKKTIENLEMERKTLASVIEEDKRKSSEWKQTLQRICGEIHAKLKFLDYEQYHGDLKQSLTPTLTEIKKLLEELFK